LCFGEGVSSAITLKTVQHVIFLTAEPSTAQLHVLFVLSNLWMVRKRLLAPTGQVRPLAG